MWFGAGARLNYIRTNTSDFRFWDKKGEPGIVLRGREGTETAVSKGKHLVRARWSHGNTRVSSGGITLQPKDIYITLALKEE